MTNLEKVEQAGTSIDVPAAEQRRLAALMKQCVTLAKSDLVPKALKDKPDNIFALALYGEQFGLTPIHAIQRIYIIQGTFEPKAEVLAGVIMRAGHELRWDEVSSERCTVSIKRRGTDYWQATTWTLDQAKRAGLLDVWVEQRVQDGTWPNGDKKWKVETFVVGDIDGIFTAEERARRGLGPIPEWAQEQVAAGNVKRKDPWFQFPDDMLAAKALRRGGKRIVGDALLGLGEDVDLVDWFVPETRLPQDAQPTPGPGRDDDDDPGGVSARAEDAEPSDDAIEDADVVDEPPAGPAPDNEEPLDPAAAQGKATRRLMVTCGKAFPENDAPRGSKTHRQKLLRRAAQFAVLKEHRSAKDLTIAELDSVEAWIYANFLSDSAVMHMRYEILDGDVVKFILGDKSKEIPPAPADLDEAA